MPLVSQEFKTGLKTFILQANASKQTDLDAAIDSFCLELENLVYAAIKSATIVIPSGAIAVTGTSLAQVNPLPITLTGVIE